MSLPLGVRVRMRLSEIVHPDGTTGVAADRVCEESEDTTEANPGMRAALEAARHFAPSKAAGPSLPATVTVPEARRYAGMRAPSFEYRMLAAFKAWAIIQLFHPRPPSAWNGSLPEFIERMAAATDSVSYGRAAVYMASRIRDGHTSVGYAPLFMAGPPVYAPRFLPPPFTVRIVEDRLVVTQVGDPGAAGNVRVGDVVRSIDGEDAVPRVRRFAEERTAQRMRAWLAGKGCGPGTPATEPAVDPGLRGALGADSGPGLPMPKRRHADWRGAPGPVRGLRRRRAMEAERQGWAPQEPPGRSCHGGACTALIMEDGATVVASRRTSPAIRDGSV